MSQLIFFYPLKNKTRKKKQFNLLDGFITTVFIETETEIIFNNLSIELDLKP